MKFLPGDMGTFCRNTFVYADHGRMVGNSISIPRIVAIAKNFDICIVIGGEQQDKNYVEIPVIVGNKYGWIDVRSLDVQVDVRS